MAARRSGAVGADTFLALRNTSSPCRADNTYSFPQKTNMAWQRAQVSGQAVFIIYYPMLIPTNPRVSKVFHADPCYHNPYPRHNARQED